MHPLYRHQQALSISTEKKWWGYNEPIEQDSAIYHQLLAALPSDRLTWIHDTAGYSAYWTVRNNQLYLDSIMVIYESNDPLISNWQCISENVMQQVFKNYYTDDGILVSWYNGKIRATKGKRVYNVYMIKTNYEQEMFLSIDNGIVTDSQLFHNRLVTDGFSIESRNELSERISQFTFNTRKQDLKHAEKVVFLVRDVQADSLGNMIDCQVEAHIIYVTRKKECVTTKGVALEMKKQLMDVRPWKTYYINGEYILPFWYEPVCIPIRLIPENNTEELKSTEQDSIKVYSEIN